MVDGKMMSYYLTRLQRLSREPGMSKTEFLHFLTNKFGFDVEICYNYYHNDTKMFSRWKSFLWLLEYESDEYVKEVRCTRDEFIRKATHRSVLDIEMMIDIDEPGEFDTIKDKARHIIQQLKKNNIIHTTYFSGSKSYHISIILPELRLYSKSQQNKLKKQVLENIGADPQKASYRNMIAMEGEPHWKTGQIKQEAEL